MADFQRRISPAGLAALERMSAPSEQTWWRDLLQRWRVSGTAPDDRGLRLAVRNGYLNFYRYGQSVARIGFAKDGTPAALTHLKYVDAGSQEKGTARLCDGTVTRTLGDTMPYGGASMLADWIDAAECKAQRVKAGEKILVDQAVAANAEIIDLEMTLPATKRGESAPRIDFVALELNGDIAKIVFWEAKTIDDNRIKVTANGDPEVFDQLERYRIYLSSEKHRALVKTAYRNTCDLLVRFKNMLGEQAPSFIERVARGDTKLEVDPEPRLLIFDDGRRSAEHWATHETALREKLFVQVISPNESFRLARK